ncbi:MAG: hypothetical protein EOP21_05345, partial [Hyphomicrobiales bacterium]
AERLIVKPNASSASWGIKLVDSWHEALGQLSTSLMPHEADDALGFTISRSAMKSGGVTVPPVRG